MAVPKRKTSRANTRKRRSTWKAERPALITIAINNRSFRVPYHLAPAYRRGLLAPPAEGES
ncbi:50S ribosomal protein L32 [Spiractinospora alimapuensis]|uniref:50S ribosomal protein L32 n=1 Tax=Spiractinospora alimapuensis TaxID=2820884 RepID=UPI001F3AFFBA|nr:50S ribosomal protein L32 [Spiractinospora alimapuensis]QVQ51879.1 50S ribosomal protein L32 [Spiractinospora alimapuensis]